VLNRGRSGRDFLGASFSASDDELADEDGLAVPSAMEFEDAPGIAAVGWLMGSDPCDAMLQNEVCGVSFASKDRQLK
jgi:hypothetical protein